MLPLGKNYFVPELARTMPCFGNYIQWTESYGDMQRLDIRDKVK